jgi:hypothetical protein
VLHVKDDRHVGGKASSKDVLSFKAQCKHGFRVRSLPSALRRPAEELHGPARVQRDVDCYEDQLQDSRQWPVPDRACFRIDFPQFLRTLSRRDCRLLHFLAQGNSARQAAQKFKLSPGRITQLRQQWCRDWYTMHGESAPV